MDLSIMPVRLKVRRSRVFASDTDYISTGPTPALLVIIFDTNPHAWAKLNASLPLSKVVANVLVFINAHLAISNANKVAILASHSNRAVWLYPESHVTNEDVEMRDVADEGPEDANKYRPFALVEHALLKSLRNLVATTSEADISSSTNTQMAGALTLALAYINKSAGDGNLVQAKEPTADTDTVRVGGLQSRILVLSVSGDLAQQYIPIMNTTFAAQRLQVPIDIMKLAGDTVFLQQAADATKGVYMQLQHPEGLLQYLMMAFLPDQISRKLLIAPRAEQVDFRAACFCHRKVVDVGFVCSICLSSKFANCFTNHANNVSILRSPRGCSLFDLLDASATGQVWFETSSHTSEEEEEKEGGARRH